jgi:hypothetical protein
VQIERLTNVWGAFTDHVALRAVVRMVPRRVPFLQDPGPQGLPDGEEAAFDLMSASLKKEVGPCQISGASGSLTESFDVHKHSEDLQVVVIASAAETAITRFQHLVRLCQEDPMQREDLEEDSLMPWKDVPVACAFRKIQTRRGRAQRRRVTPADKQAQRQRYAKCKIWALQCGLSESEFQSILKGKTSTIQRGHDGLPACLRHGPGHCNLWQHAKLVCVDVAIRRAATDAGGRLGGEQTAELAAEEVSALMSSDASRLSRWTSISESWRRKSGLNLTADACKTLGHNPRKVSPRLG